METQTGLLEGDEDWGMSEMRCYEADDDLAESDESVGDLESVVARERRARRHSFAGVREREMMARPLPYRERSRLAEPVDGYSAPRIQVSPPPPVGWGVYRNGGVSRQMEGIGGKSG